MLKKIIKWTLILLGTGVLCFVGYMIYFFYAFGAFDTFYSPAELIENFKEKQVEIYDLKNYFNEIVPKNKQVEIEFKNDNELFRFGIKPLDFRAGDPFGPMFLEWDLKTDTPKMDSLISTLGWNQQTLKSLKEKLDEANCIQIESGEPTKIGFKRSGMGMYFFNVFSKSIPDSLRSYYNDSCKYIFVNKKFVLEYGGGAVGPQCF
jgi:hypothetical protein